MSLSNVRSLVVDWPGAANTLALGLVESGYHVDVRHTLGEALEVAGARQPGLIVVEWVLPDCTGPNIIRELLGVAPDAHLVVATAHAQICDALSAIRGGALDFLSKPVTASEVLASLSEGSRDRSAGTGGMTLEEVRREYIREVFARCGSIAQTARILRLDRTSLRRMMLRLGVPKRQVAVS